MFGECLGQQRGQTEPIGISDNKSDNILRILTMLEKALNRLLRHNYYNRSQYPQLIQEIEEALNKLRSWIQDYKNFTCLCGFNLLLGLVIKDCGDMIAQLMAVCKPLPGKKQMKKKHWNQEQIALCQSIDSMLEHIAKYLNKPINNDTLIAVALEKALQKAFEKHCLKKHKRKIKFSLSKRGKKTYLFACVNKEEYLAIVHDPHRFRIEVVDKLSEYSHATGHKSSCKISEGYNLIGFRQRNRKTIMVGGQEQFPIRMVQCKECKEKFSLLPSFLPREKHFGIDIIGHVFQSMLLFSQSIQSALQNLKILGKGVKSKQTILNWLRWIGTLAPATILTRAGVVGSGYLQEDEGFEKEPNLRTYSVVMVDPKSLLVWHADYVDHVDEKTLCASFKNFLQRVSFKIIGVTKDKWEASTKALKAVFKNIWIGLCHRHCLKKFHHALVEYQEETKCSKKEIKSLYIKFKKILETSNSQVSLEVKIKSADEPAFNHPLLQGRLAELKKNATHYTCYKKRNGITKTTSIVDNFLKLVKRKLKMVESFRDKEYTQILFQALANTRNFVPFLSGAKNAHKSPFMLAHGQTFDLPWMQVMNVHNAFLFTADAF